MDTKRLCPSCQKPLAPNVPMGLCPECLIKAGFPTGVETDTGSAKQPAFVPPTVEEIAKLFPQLEILELVGKGGMGAVYKARQKQLNRFVALKILPPGIGSEPAFAERFTREAQALARLNHPSIVTLYEFGETSGQFYFLTEFVDGVNLRQLLAGSRISAREALAIVPQICDALQFAHDQGIVHRDIKPENILLDRRGRVKVADFGLAKLVGAGNEPMADGGIPTSLLELTESGKIMGTPNYMAPEQVEHPGEVDNRADIYALGVVFYQMLTGELPGKKIEPPSSKVQIDVRLDEIVLRALEKKPELRYQQVSEVKTMMETIVANNPSPIASPAQFQPSTQTMNTIKSFWRGVVMFAGVTACVVLAVFAILLLFKKQIMLGPTDSGPSSGGANWLSGAYGTATVSIDLSDPASKGGYDLVISNTVAGTENKSDWRSLPFPLGSAAGGSRPITFSFAYKLADTVAKGNNVLVHLRFFDSTGTRFISQKVIPVGAQTGDSEMTMYKTITMNRVVVPRKAQTADVWINAGSFEPWISGTAQFANISVTTVPRSWFFKIGIVAAILLGICGLTTLLFHLGRKWSTNTALEPTATAP